jgi:four helix bundle protein
MERIDFKVNEEDRKDIIKRTYKFAIRILYIVNRLPKNVLTYRIIDQLMGCGTAIGSNTEEASAGFSKSDFTYKMSIASKEARETNYFLRLLRDSGLIKDDSLLKEIIDAIDESSQIKRILTSVVKTSQAKTEVKKSKRQQ